MNNDPKLTALIVSVIVCLAYIAGYLLAIRIVV